MTFHGPDRDEQPIADLVVRAALSDQSQHLDLSRGQTIRVLDCGGRFAPRALGLVRGRQHEFGNIKSVQRRFAPTELCGLFDNALEHFGSQCVACRRDGTIEGATLRRVHPTKCVHVGREPAQDARRVAVIPAPGGQRNEPDQPESGADPVRGLLGQEQAVSEMLGRPDELVSQKLDRPEAQMTEGGRPPIAGRHVVLDGDPKHSGGLVGAAQLDEYRRQHPSSEARHVAVSIGASERPAGGRCQLRPHEVPVDTQLDPAPTLQHRLPPTVTELHAQRDSSYAERASTFAGFVARRVCRHGGFDAPQQDAGVVDFVCQGQGGVDSVDGLGGTLALLADYTALDGQTSPPGVRVGEQRSGRVAPRRLLEGDAEP